MTNDGDSHPSIGPSPLLGRMLVALSRNDMGIEFTDLDQATQKRLQKQVETIAVESPEIGSGRFSPARSRQSVLVFSRNFGYLRFRSTKADTNGRIPGY